MGRTEKSRKKRQSSEEHEKAEVIEARVTKVLTCLFKNMSLDGLLRARLACKDWNRVVCNNSHLSEIAELVLRGDPDEILATLIHAEYRPWSKFRFIMPSLDNTTEIQKVFWAVYGTQTKSLDFVIHSLGPVPFLNVLVACPNLEELSFSIRCVYDYRPPKSNYEPIITPPCCHQLIPQDYIGVRVLEHLYRLRIVDANFAPPAILRDILNWAPNLTQLTLFDTNRAVIPHWDVRNIILFTQRRVQSMTRLELTGCHIHPDHVTALAKMKKLKLKSLHLRFAHVTDLGLIALFRNQKELEEIDLSYTNFSEKAFGNTSCVFYKLKRLSLAGFTSAVKSVGFLCRMPNLVELNLSGGMTSQSLNWEQLVSCMLPIKLRKLQSLNLSGNGGLGVFPRANLFSSLMTCYNHITCLNISQNSFLKDSFIHEIWRNLRTLRVVFLENLTGITNEAFNGIRQVQIQAMLANGSIEKANPHLLRYQNTGGSYVGLCQDLEVLSIAHNGRLSDFTTKFGLRDLYNLRKLNLSGCTQLTYETLFDLVTFCPFLEYLDLTGVPVPEYWVQWAKEQRPKLKRIVGQTSSTPQSGRQRQLSIKQYPSTDFQNGHAPISKNAAGAATTSQANKAEDPVRPTSGPTGDEGLRSESCRLSPKL